MGPDLGRYRVIEITHQVDHKGLYSNAFKGVAGLTETLPLPENVTPPIAFPEPAIVIDNADPKKVGRVQVCFFWQSDEQNSNWLRVQTPDAGTSSTVEKYRGLLFVPEIDDQVMVAYEQGNPSRPYLAGSLFHGANSGGMAPDNNLKSITTRSGHTIVMGEPTVLISRATPNKKVYTPLPEIQKLTFSRIDVFANKVSELLRPFQCSNVLMKYLNAVLFGCSVFFYLNQGGVK